jgi:hypothetical protein
MRHGRRLRLRASTTYTATTPVTYCTWVEGHLRVYLTPHTCGTSESPPIHTFFGSLPPSSRLTPTLCISPCILTSRNRLSLRRTIATHHRPHRRHIMALFSLILELLAQAMMLLSAPHLLDRVLARLCKRSFLLRLSLRGIILINRSCVCIVAWMLPLGAGIA